MALTVAPPLSPLKAELQGGPRLRPAEDPVYESHGGPAVPPEPAHQDPEALRGGREGGRLLPVSRVVLACCVCVCVYVVLKKTTTSKR